MSSHCFLAWNFLLKNLLIVLCCSFVCNFFFLTALKTLFFFVFSFRQFIYNVSWCSLDCVQPIWYPLGTWIWMSISFPRFKFSVIIALNILSVPFSLWNSYNANVTFHFFYNSCRLFFTLFHSFSFCSSDCWMGCAVLCVLWLGPLVRQAEGCVQQWVGLQIRFPAWVKWEKQL